MGYVGKKPADIIATAVDTTTGTFSGDLTVDTSTLHVDSANNRVGVGTASPQRDLVVNSGSSSGYIQLVNTASGTTSSNGLEIKLDSGGAEADIINRENGRISFWTNNTERMRIDSSGNLLVGKTAISVAAVGVEARADGIFASTRSGGEAIRANRTSSDGDIIQLRKDNTTVANIGVSGSNNPYFSSAVANHGGLVFSDGGSSTPQMNPISSGSTLVDNAMNIGSASYRFKDLYLSGGAYIGGTGSANYLDDYEEGTWDPTLDGSTGNPSGTASSTQNVGFYTKVGRMVMASFRVEYSSVSGGSGAFRIGGLPFNVISNSNYRSSGNLSFFRGITHGGNRPAPHAILNTDVFGFYKNANATEFDLPINTTDLSSSLTMHGHVMYITS